MMNLAAHNNVFVLATSEQSDGSEGRSWPANRHENGELYKFDSHTDIVDRFGQSSPSSRNEGVV